MEEKVSMQQKIIKLGESCKEIENLYKEKTIELLKANKDLKE